MKNFLKLILFACFLFYIPETFASEKASILFDLKDDPQYELDKENTFLDQVTNIIYVLDDYNKSYPKDKLQEDFSEDVAKRFPDLTQQQVYDTEERIRYTLNGYRYFKNLYDEVMEKYLTPEPPPLVVAEEDYDGPYTADYVYAGDDNHTVIITDIKKVLSYGSDRRDFLAAEARYKRKLLEKESTDNFDEFRKMIGKIEFKKIPHYGKLYDNPFTGKSGLGNWERGDKAKVRIASIFTNINNNKKVRAAFHFIIPQRKMLLAQSNQLHSKLSFEIIESENLVGYEVSYPAATRWFDKTRNDNVVYRGDFAVPVVFEVEDINKPLKIIARVKGTVCDNEKCDSFILEPKFGMDSGKGFETAISNFLYQVYNASPQKENSDVEIKSVSYEEPLNSQEGQVLKVRLEADNPSELNIFAESTDGILLYRPTVTIDGDRATARFMVADKDVNLDGKFFDITVQTGSYRSIRHRVQIYKSSIFDIETRTLSISIVLLAILGGFILNFMPCVFPVLSLKVLSITKFGAMNDKSIRQSFMMTILGIFTAFLFLAVFLGILKLLGYAVGWGMQFQNSTFLVCIMFVITLFLAQILGLINISTPNWANKLLQKREHQDNMLHFLTGLFLVILATPCTAPYLGTALGFALSGSVADIFIVVMAVGIGLSIPYIVIAFLPNVSIYMPKPGPWMDKLSKFMILMLFLTLIWLVSVLSAQTSLGTSLRMIAYLSLFLFALWFRKMGLDSIEVKKFERNIRLKTISYFNRIIFSILLILFALAIVDTYYYFTKNEMHNEQEKDIKINTNQIKEYLGEGKTVILSVGADWCLTCKFNDVTVFSNTTIKEMIQRHDIKLINVDWTSYNREVLDYMEKYGRKGLPFYIIYSPKVPDGMVLPEVLSEIELSKIINNLI